MEIMTISIYIYIYIYIYTVLDIIKLPMKYFPLYLYLFSIHCIYDCSNSYLVNLKVYLACYIKYNLFFTCHFKKNRVSFIFFQNK